MQEYDLYRYWEHYGRTGQTVRLGSHSLRVLHPGKLNLRCGPDYTGARFQLDGVVCRGDVELHLTPDDWYVHGHHLDRAYAGVILHLVSGMNGCSGEEVRNNYLQESILTLVLPPPKEVREPGQVHGRCQRAFQNRAELPMLLEKLALNRYNRKVQQFIQQLQREQPASLLYRYLLRALGYSGNETPFTRLAGLVPPSLAEGLSNDQLRLYAAYTGQAGFLETAPADAFVSLLKTYFQESASLLAGVPMTQSDWHFAGQRPANHPHFRLAGWAALLSQNGCCSFLGQPKELFRERLAFRSLYSRMIHLFRVPASNYWSTHLSLGVNGSRLSGLYFSEKRIAEFLINVLIPLEAAKASLEGSIGFADYLQGFYLWIPLRSVYPSLQKRFPAIRSYHGNHPGQVINQGLIYLHDEFCRAAQCRNCPAL